MIRLRTVWNIIRQGGGIPCLFHLLTGLYCPGCGGTRAVWYLLHGQILKSVQYHPLVLYMALVLGTELICRLRVKMEYRRGGKTERKTKQADEGVCCSGAFSPPLPMRRYEKEVILGTVIVLVNWIFKNYMLVARGIDLLPEKLY